MFSSISFEKSLDPNTDLLPLIFQQGNLNGYAAVAWRLPDSNTTHVLISKEIQRLTPDHSIEDLPPGFLVSYYDTQKQRLFLKADYCFTLYDDKTFQHDGATDWLIEQLNKTGSSNERFCNEPLVRSIETDKSHYLNLVQQAIDYIRQGEVEKLVATRRKVIDLPQGFNPLNAFKELCKTYTKAMISMFSIPGVGCWLGATPELLVCLENKTIFKTVALAGTKPYAPGMDIKNVAWTQKEIEEQALVERYIISCFKKIRLREYIEQGPKTTIAGNLLHLKTEFMVDLKQTGFPQLGSMMLNLLHPTSAVCGVPLEKAQTFLTEHEGYDRSFFTGFLGPVNINGDTHLFVNLRCMQLLRDKGICYAGAGITLDSMPESEWEETEIKMKTLLKPLNLSNNL
jgi:isochorismate synthase